MPLGQLLVDVYSRLEGFPAPVEAPEYYAGLEGVGSLTLKPGVSVLVAVRPDDRLLGGVVYLGDLREYGTPGPTTSIRDASGIRLLGVAHDAQGLGVGRALTVACIERARNEGHTRVVLHTTRAMPAAWRLYEQLGFTRSPELDFLDPRGPEVLGFRLGLVPQPPDARST